jgi:hypothetical protein
MNTPTRELKQLRADMDLLLVLAGQIRDSRETNVAFTTLQTAKMHIGNSLYEMQQAKIYTESQNASNNTIDKYHVDEEIKAIETPTDWNQGTHVQNVKIMRRELDSIIVRIKTLIKDIEFMVNVSQYDFAINFFAEALIKTREAQNWYGMELGRIRDTSIG